jgi:hypothetical protein
MNYRYTKVRVGAKVRDLHLVIWEAHHGPRPDGMWVDHINGDPTDNRIENLRLATPAQNAANQGLQKRSATGYKGVRWEKAKQRYVSSVGWEGKTRHIGYFDCPVEAAKAYDARLVELYGEFARTNKMMGLYE